MSNIVKALFKDINAIPAITPEIIATMEKQEGKAFATVLLATPEYALGYGEQAVILTGLKKIGDLDLAVGTKIFFNEDGTLSHAETESGEKPVPAVPAVKTRSTGSIERGVPDAMYSRK